jgi:hypothetical protein
MDKPFAKLPVAGQRPGNASPGSTDAPANQVSSGGMQPGAVPRADQRLPGAGLPPPRKRTREEALDNANSESRRWKIEGKLSPYFRKRPSVSELAFLNCSVNVAPISEHAALHSPDPLLPIPVSSSLVACRHFATSFATHRGKKAALVEQFSTPAAVQGYYNGRLDAVQAKYIEVMASASQNCKHLVSGAQLGSYLSNLAKALEQLHCTSTTPPQSELNSLLLTAKHVMAVEVARKAKDGVVYFSAKFFDPEVTNSYRRVEAPRAEGLAALTFADLCVRGRDAASIAQTNGTCLAAVCLDGGHLPPLARLDAPPTPENMHLALSIGMSAEFDSMIKGPRAGAPLSDEEMLPLLMALSSRQSAPGLFVALQDDQPAAVGRFFEAVLSYPSFEFVRMQLLASPDFKGQPALFAALAGGAAASAREYVAAVFRSGLPLAQKVELLASKDVSGLPALTAAMYLGKVESIKAFVQAVANEESLGDRRQELLAAKDLAGTSALGGAVYDSQGLAVGAFVHAVTTSRLDRLDQLRLLKATDDAGAPALHFALCTDALGGVESYVKAVTDSNLSDRDKCELMAARNASGVSGVHAAVAAGNVASVGAFCDAVRASNLPYASKSELMAAAPPIMRVAAPGAPR